MDIILYCDGGCSNNQLLSERKAYGSVRMLVDGKPTPMTYKGVKHDIMRLDCGNNTNNEAELKTAVVAASYIADLILRTHESILPKMYFEIRADSALFDDPASVKAKNLKPLAAELIELQKTYPIKIRKVDREEIKQRLGH